MQWQVWETDSFLALKCPVEEYWARFVWGTPSGNLGKIRLFFDQKPFTWYLGPEQKEEEKLLLSNGFEGPEANPEMTISVPPSGGVLSLKKSEGVSVHLVEDEQTMREWLILAAEVFDTPYAVLHDFITPFTACSQSLALLATCEGKSAGCALLCQTQAIMGLYYVGVHSNARRRGIATQLLQKCMELAQARKAKCILLYASPEGELLYKNFGFAMTQYLTEYHCR